MPLAFKVFRTIGPHRDVLASAVVSNRSRLFQIYSLGLWTRPPYPALVFQTLADAEAFKREILDVVHPKLLQIWQVDCEELTPMNHLVSAWTLRMVAAEKFWRRVAKSYNVEAMRDVSLMFAPTGTLATPALRPVQRVDHL